MAAITAAATSPVGAYQREASRLVPAVPKVGGKVVSRDAGLSIGPFSIRYSATDYEFDLTGATAQTPFSDALDAAATSRQLADTAIPSREAPAPNALTRRQALAGYAAAGRVPVAPVSSFRATA
jgi:hypothetical protein